MLSKEESNKILYEFNNTKTEYQKEKTIHKLFEEQVEKTPDKIAVVSNGVSLTYKELNKKANQLAHYIKQNYDIQDGDIICLMTKRTVELTIGQIAILKTGACYLPLDPNYPKDRIEYILTNSKTKLIVTNIAEKNISYEECDMLNICLTNKNIYESSNTDNLQHGKSSNQCYSIYTSGSTGKPKGVMITHSNVHNFIVGMKEHLELSNKTIVSLTTISFDIFVLESLLPLTIGMKIILANEEEQNMPELLNELCLKNNVDIIQTTPSRYGLLLNDRSNLNYLKNMSIIISGGEPMTNKLLSKFKEITNAKIYNIYGPTETTVWSTIMDLTDKDEITIGKPIANTNIYILNKNKKILPIGAIGEIYIGGEGVSLGYINNKLLTDEKFTINPYNKNEIIYATGDLGKWLSNGEIVCLGRNDNQIKIAGNRVELSEIEKAILSINDISNAVVVVRKDDAERDYICAYVVSNARIRYSDVREVLSKILPVYMIPSQLMQLENIPYTTNGKVNKLALPIPNGMNIEKRTYNPPVTELQKELVSIFESLLPIRPIGINDNFFEIGGDSLLAMQLQIQLLNRDKKITYGDLYNNPTVLGIEQAILNSMIVEKITTQNNIEFNKFEELLNSNIKMPESFIKSNLGNILLTGATGFLGSHLLEYFINNSKGKAYCIIRKETGRSPEKKLLETLNSYFEGKYVELLNKRIFIIEADFTKDNFGIEKEQYMELGNTIDWVINAAAKVTHFGNYKEFEKINVIGTKNLVEFCNKFNKKLFHISTMSISGNALAKTYDLIPTAKEHMFTERDFYIKQSLENVYVRTKFEAETIVLNAINNGLDAYIGRMGNLTSRYSDGKFQKNVEDNAFMNKIKSFIGIGFVPIELANEYVELTPVDFAAKAVILLMQYANRKNRIFHIYNNKFIAIKSVIDFIETNCNKKIKIITNQEFSEVLKNLLNKDEKIVQGIATDLNENAILQYTTNIKINCDFTTSFLQNLGFNWLEIDDNYLEKVFKYLKSINFIK